MLHRLTKYDYCGLWGEGGAVKLHLPNVRNRFLATFKNDEQIDAGTAVRDIWTSRLCPQRYRILLGTRDRLVGGVRGQLEQHRFGFYALIHYSWADAGIHDKSEQQEHLMLPVHPQTCSYTR